MIDGRIPKQSSSLSLPREMTGDAEPDKLDWDKTVSRTWLCIIPCTICRYSSSVLVEARRAMFSAFASKHKFQSQKGETLLLQTDLSRSNTVVPKAIQWKDISLLEDWTSKVQHHQNYLNPMSKLKTLPSTQTVKSNYLSTDTLQVPDSQMAFPLPVQ